MALLDRRRSAASAPPLALLLVLLLAADDGVFGAMAKKAPRAKAKAPSASRGFGAAKKPETAEVMPQWKSVVGFKCDELRRMPNNPQLWLELGALMVKGGEYAEAERVFRWGAALHPGVEALSAAALTLGGDSEAYWHGESKAGQKSKQPPSKPVEFESFQAPPELLGEYDQVDRSVAWASESAKASKLGVVHRSLAPLIDPADCAWLIETTERHAEESGGWTTARHVQAPTTDVPVSQVPAIRSFFDEALRTKLFPMLEALYPYAVPSAENLRVMDAFVVRYDATAQRELPVHQDENILSFTIALNDRSEYEGGGTCFEGLRPVGAATPAKFEPAVLNADAGGIVTFPGKLRHGGSTITSGRRYIIPLFVYIDANRSGKQPGYIVQSLDLPPLSADAAVSLSRYASTAAQS